MIWGISQKNIKDKAYLKELDFIRENMIVDTIYLSIGNGVQLENLQQCHSLMKEYVEYAHKLGFKVIFRQSQAEGFFNTVVNAPPGTPVEVEQGELFTIDEPRKAEGIVNDYEVEADENGFARIEHKARWGRNKIRPLRCNVLRVYAFRKTQDGFYEEGTLQDVTEKILVTNSRPALYEVEFHGGKEFANHTLFFMVVQYYNGYEFFGGSFFEKEKALMEAYKDVPFDGVCMDEVGFLLLNTNGVSCGAEPPFRGRFYSQGQEEYYRKNLDLDLVRLLFDMRYAPNGMEKVRIKAINIYFEELRKAIIRNENAVAELSGKLWGEDVYLSAHNTFHNHLDSDEVWHTGSAWWDLPRDFGHTDENIAYPIRMGVMLAAKEPIMLDMFYSRSDEAYYKHIVEGAPFNCREFHHPWPDKDGKKNFYRMDFLRNITKLDKAIAPLDKFQNVPPKLDLLVIFGSSAQNNWYPDKEARNLWDIDGSLGIDRIAHELWDAGYRCALVPDYAISDGRIQYKNGKIFFNGHSFTHSLFLYPKYAKKEVYNFLNSAGKEGLPIAAVGKRADQDFNGEKAELAIPLYEEFDLAIPEKLSCPKSAIPNGCVYTDGSFVLVNQAGLLEGKAEAMDIMIEGVRYKGINTGILAYRNGLQYATEGGTLRKAD